LSWDYKNPVKCKGKCKNCGSECEEWIALETPFTSWIRENGNLWVERSRGHYSIMDIDYVVWNFTHGWFMFIEEKTHGKKPMSEKQKDAFSIVTQLCEYSAGLKYMEWRTFKGMRQIKFKGIYYITFSGTNPEDSETITINGKNATKEDIIHLMSTGELR